MPLARSRARGGVGGQLPLTWSVWVGVRLGLPQLAVRLADLRCSEGLVSPAVLVTSAFLLFALPPLRRRRERDASDHAWGTMAHMGTGGSKGARAMRGAVVSGCGLLPVGGGVGLLGAGGRWAGASPPLSPATRPGSCRSSPLAGGGHGYRRHRYAAMRAQSARAGCGLCGNKLICVAALEMPPGIE